MKKFFYSLLVAGTSFFLSGCSEDSPRPVDSGYRFGAYVINEGSFMNNNGSISYLDLDSNYVINNIFQAVNGRSLGDVVQSFSVAGNMGLIVVNHSAKVEVVDLESFVSLGTITGCDYPRYTLPLGNEKVYLTNGAFGGKVYILDLASLSIVDSIAVGMGPEVMARVGNFVFVANSGGWGHDSTVFILDAMDDVIEDTLYTGDNPVDLTLDNEGNLWVLCKGKVVYDQNFQVVEETDSRLQKIDLSTLRIVEDLVIGQKGDYFNPIRLASADRGKTILFAEKAGVYAVDAAHPAVPDEPLIRGNFYGLDVDPVNNIIYVTDAVDFSSAGILYRYTTEGVLLDSVTTGIAPNGVFFNERVR